MRRKTGKILGISIDGESKKTILEKVRKGFLKRELGLATRDWKTEKPIVIVTPNPEQIVFAYGHPWFAKLLNEADVALPDGIGLTFAMRKFNTQYPISNDQHGIERIPGVEFMEDLVRIASKERVRIGLIGGEGKVAVKAFECLQPQYPGLAGVAVEVPQLEIIEQQRQCGTLNTAVPVRSSDAMERRREYRIPASPAGWPNTAKIEHNQVEIPDLTLLSSEAGVMHESLGKAFGIEDTDLKQFSLHDSLLRPPSSGLRKGTAVFSIQYLVFDEYMAKLAELILAARIQIVFVALGAPKQELFIHRLRLELQKQSASRSRIQQLKNRNANSETIQYSQFSIHNSVLMSVGGAFDMIAGKTRRAPHFIRMIGFEWFYRLILEPWRWRRQLALLKFVYLCIRYH